MTDRDFGAEIDALKEEFKEMKQYLLKNFLPPIQPVTPPDGKNVLSSEGFTVLNELRNLVLEYTNSSGETGALAYTGTFSSDKGTSARQSIWGAAVATDTLLELNSNRMAEKVLSSVGNSQRLAILLALLKKPMTVNQLVEAVGFNTTGQMYHHLKPLVTADIIREEKGVYAVIPYRVQGLVLLLAGIHDLTDTHYSSGKWDENAN